MNAHFPDLSFFEINVRKDENIREKIRDFVLEKGWENAYISGAIGSVKDVTFATPKTGIFPPEIDKTLYHGPGEILAFTGEIMKIERMDPGLKGIYDMREPLFIHIHASMAISGGHVYGGGFHSGKAFRCLKVYIRPQAVSTDG